MSEPIAKILLVDDVQAILDQQQRILAQYPELQVLSSLTGAEALKKVVDEHPEIVFLDLVLPDINGEQICRVIKSKPQLADIAVIIVTGKDDQQQLQRAFEAGCDAYVVKPFDEQDMLEKVRLLLAEKGIMLDDSGEE